MLLMHLSKAHNVGLILAPYNRTNSSSLRVYYRIVLIIGMKIWSMLHSACLVVFRYMKLVYLYYVFFCFTF